MYQCQYYFPNPVCLLLLIPFVIGIYITLNFKNPFIKHRIRFITIGILCILLTSLAFWGVISDYREKYTQVYRKYQRGEYEQVSGTVSDFYPRYLDGNGSDVFKVDGVEFVIGDSPGYDRQACMGGLVNRNGMFVEIRYIEYKGHRYIMYLDTTCSDTYNSDDLITSKTLP